MALTSLLPRLRSPAPGPTALRGSGRDRPTAAAADDRIGELWSALNGDQAGLEITDHHAEQTR